VLPIDAGQTLLTPHQNANHHKRDKTADVFSTSAHWTAKRNKSRLQQEKHLSIVRDLPKTGEIVPANWLAYYIQTDLFVKGFVRPTSNPCASCRTAFPTALLSRGKNNYTYSLVSVKGFHKPAREHREPQSLRDSSLPYLTEKAYYTHIAQ